MGLGCESDRSFGSYILPLPVWRIHSPDKSRETPTPPPPHTSASVPFKWEEKPGKPRPCSTLFHPNQYTNNKLLDLPPRLLFAESSSSSTPKNTDTPSPTTVLDGPYVSIRPKFSSLRFLSRDSPGSNRDESNTLDNNKEHKGRGFFRKRNAMKEANKSHIWAAMCEGFKQVIPWKSRKPKREEHYNGLKNFKEVI
ncbi:hypothetical protein OROHE_006442 [Orobanche hederae]